MSGRRERIYACATPGCKYEGCSCVLQEPMQCKCCDAVAWPEATCTGCQKDAVWVEYDAPDGDD